MRRSLQIVVMVLTVMVPPAFAASTASCGSLSSECTTNDTDRDDAAKRSGRFVHKVGECTRIEKLLANPRTRELMMQEPEGKRVVSWYAGNCPLRKSEG